MAGLLADERVTQPAAAAQVLSRLRETRAPLTVVLSAGDAAYSSLLLQADPARSMLVADALHPPSGQSRMRPGTWLHLRGRVDGIEASFRTQLIAVEGNGSDAQYRLAWPAEIRYRQRREAFRVAIPASLGLGAAHLVAKDKPERAQLVDISPLGAGLRLSSASQAAVGDIVACNVPLDDGRLVGDIEIRHRELRPGATLIGARFVDLGRDQARKLRELVTRAERWWLGQRARLR